MPAPRVLPVPAGQLEQDAEPAALNVRGAHGKQEAGARAKVPAGHDAAVKAHEGAPAVLYVPAGHRVQFRMPEAG